MSDFRSKIIIIPSRNDKCNFLLLSKNFLQSLQQFFNRSKIWPQIEVFWPFRARLRRARNGLLFNNQNFLWKVTHTVGKVLVSQTRRHQNFENWLSGSWAMGENVKNVWEKIRIFRVFSILPYLRVLKFELFVQKWSIRNAEMTKLIKYIENKKIIFQMKHPIL